MSAPASLVDMIESTARTGAEVHFLPEGSTWSVRQLWDASTVAVRWLQDRTGADEPVAMALDSSADAVAMFLGACRAGRRIVSIPTPPRGSSIEDYQSFVERSCAVAEVGSLLVAASYLPLLPELAVACHSFESAQSSHGSGGVVREHPEAAELVQFTSGSTADPKGVVLPIDRVAANIHAILEVLRPAPGSAACSWLPLSHDMGLIGMALSGLCGMGPSWADGGDLVLIRPEWFLRRPESWLEACSTFRCTITAAPDFGFRHAVKRGAAGASIDLSNLQVCITGAEPVRPETLRAFADAFVPLGFDPLAFCPAYGLAEAGLAVAMTRPDEPWRSIVVDPRELGARRVTTSDVGVELVSAGSALPGYEVVARADSPGEVGRLELRGPSLLDRYIPAGPSAIDGWFVTSDEGVVRDGQVFVTGRADDVVVVAGRNLYLADIEDAARATDAVDAGKVQAIAVAGGFSLVAEAPPSVEHRAVVAALRRAVVARVGAEPSEVLLVERGALPRTASGKPRRKLLAQQLVDGEIEPVYRPTAPR